MLQASGFLFAHVHLSPPRCKLEYPLLFRMCLVTHVNTANVCGYSKHVCQSLSACQTEELKAFTHFLAI